MWLNHFFCFRNLGLCFSPTTGKCGIRIKISLPTSCPYACLSWWTVIVLWSYPGKQKQLEKNHIHWDTCRTVGSSLDPSFVTATAPSACSLLLNNRSTYAFPSYSLLPYLCGLSFFVMLKTFPLQVRFSQQLTSDFCPLLQTYFILALY